MDRQTVSALGLTVIILLGVLELVRRRRLREEYSLLWLLTGLVLILLSAWAAPLDLISAATGIYRTTALFVVAGGFFLLILLYYSTVLTRLADQNKQLAQELALLRQEVEALRQNVDAGDSKSQAAAQPAVADNVQSLPESQST